MRPAVLAHSGGGAYPCHRGTHCTACRHQVVNDYKVAAFPSRRGQNVGPMPEGKRHAYLNGAKTTACGFGLVEMHLFSRLRFSDQPPSQRCRMCARIIVVADR